MPTDLKERQFMSQASGARKVAIVAQCVGQKYVDMFETYCRPSWSIYAQRIGADIILVDRLLDDSDRAKARSPVWQKLIIPEMPEMQAYDQILLIDTDIVINTKTAPSIFDATPVDRIGAVESYSNPNKAIYSDTLARMYAYWDSIGQPYVRNLTGADLYRQYGFADPPDDVVQTGAFVLSPRLHAPILRRAYDNYEDRGGLLNHEARPLSFEMVKSGRMHWLDYRFNFVFSDQMFMNYRFLTDNDFLGDLKNALGENVHTHVRYHLLKRCIGEMLENAFFLHFAGYHGMMKLAV